MLWLEFVFDSGDNRPQSGVGGGVGARGVGDMGWVAYASGGGGAEE